MCIDEAEFCVCLASLYIGISLNKPVIVESNSSFVVSYLANDILNRSPFVDIKREALSIMQIISRSSRSIASQTRRLIRLLSLVMIIGLTDLFIIVFHPAWRML